MAVLGELRKPYQSFHIPKGEEASRAEALVHLAKFLNHTTSQPIHSELFKRQCAHVSKQGALSFYPEKNHSGYIEYTPDGHGRYQSKRFGEITAPLFERKGKSGELQLFVGPKTFFGGHPNIYLSHSTQTPVLALLEPSVPLVHKAVTQQNIKRVRIICERDEGMSENLIQFKNELKKSLELFSIDVSMSTEPSLDILKGIHERDDFDQGRSMSLGGR